MRDPELAGDFAGMLFCWTRVSLSARGRRDRRSGTSEHKGASRDGTDGMRRHIPALRSFPWFHGANGDIPGYLSQEVPVTARWMR